MQQGTKNSHIPSSTHYSNNQPMGFSNVGPVSSHYRKFHHRRINTEIQQPVPSNIQPSTKYQPYQQPSNISTNLYKKDLSKNKIEAYSGNANINGASQSHNNNNLSSQTSNRLGNPTTMGTKDVKSYKFAKSNGLSHGLPHKYLKTEPDAEQETLQKNKSGIKGNTVIFNNKYEIEGVAGKGTFGVVYFGRVLLTGEKIALKKVLQDKKYKNRELQILKQVKHLNILYMKDYFFTNEDSDQFLNVVMDYYSDNLYQVIKKKELSPLLTKIYIYQVLRGLNYLSSLSIAHRDIKPQNILVDKITHKVVICDFGSAKRLVKGEPNIAYICSRCYRAPQLIFGATQYTPQIDMWSMGCVIVQMINGDAPFLGDSQIDQLLEIIKILGTPQKTDIEQMNPKYDLRQYKKFPNIKPVPWRKILKTQDPLLIDLVTKILQYSPLRRLTAAGAINHPYFDELRQIGGTQQKDFEYLKKMKINQLPQLFNFTAQQKNVLQGSSKKMIEKEKDIFISQTFVQESKSNNMKEKLNKSPEHSLITQTSREMKQRMESDIQAKSKKEIVSEEFLIKQDAVKLDKNMYYHNQTSAAGNGSKLAPKRVLPPGMISSSTLGHSTQPVTVVGVKNVTGANQINSNISTFNRIPSNRFEYR